MSRALWALVASGVVVAGVAWLVAYPQVGRAPLAPVSSVAPRASAPAPEATLVEAVPEAPAQSAVAESPAIERAAALSASEMDLARAQWVDGRVVLPPGTPPDEELFVTADGGDQRVRVESDGRFRVAFSEGTRNGLVRLAGRYVYLDEPARWERGSDAPLVLEPELGGRIVVRIVPPLGVAAEGLGGRVALESPQHTGMHVFGRSSAREREVGPELELAFDALDVGREYALWYDGEAFVSDPAPARVEPGGTLHLALELRAGTTLVGRVRDESGEVVEGVLVRAFPEPRSDLPTWDVAAGFRFAQASADGSFRLGALSLGPIEVRVEQQGFEPYARRLESREVPGPLELDVVLSRGASIAGAVHWPDGSPAEADLLLVPIPSEVDADPPERLVNARSGPDGRFRAGGLSPGDYFLRARVDKTSEIVVQSEVTGRERKRRHSEPWSAELQRVSDGTQDVALVLSTGLAVTGRVRGQDGTAPREFSIEAQRITFPSNRYELRDALEQSFSDADGSFELAGFQPGRWRLIARADDHADSEPVLLQLPGATALEFVLSPEATLRGVVLDEAGEPAAHVTVTAARPGRDGPRSGPTRTLQDQTDKRGAFRLRGLPPGTMLLSAVSETGMEGQPLELELEAGQQLEDVVLHLRPSCTVLCEVQDSDGRPDATLAVHLMSVDDSFTESYVTGADGRFEARGLPAGELRALALNDDGLTLSETFELRPGTTTHVLLAPPQVALIRLHGRVLRSGEGVANARLMAWREGNEEERFGSRVQDREGSDAEGRYELRVPGPGRWMVRVHGAVSGSDGWVTPLDVPDVDAFEHDFELVVGRITGRVRTASGLALAGVRVRSEPRKHDGGPRGFASTVTDDEGRYALDVAVGLHALAAGGSDGGGETDGTWCLARIEDLRIEAGTQLEDVDFVLARGGGLTGTVRAPGGGPARGAELWLCDAQGAERVGRTEADGSFQLEGLPVGTHCLRVLTDTSASPAVLVTIGNERLEHLELELATASRHVVRGVDSAGAPLGCEIAAYDDDGHAVPIHSLGVQGAVRIGPLSPGSYVLHVRREAYFNASTFETSGSADVEVETVMTLE